MYLVVSFLSRCANIMFGLGCCVCVGGKDRPDVVVVVVVVVCGGHVRILDLGSVHTSIPSVHSVCIYIRHNYI